MLRHWERLARMSRLLVVTTWKRATDGRETLESTVDVLELVENAETVDDNTAELVGALTQLVRRSIDEHVVGECVHLDCDALQQCGLLTDDHERSADLTSNGVRHFVGGARCSA